MFDHLDSVLVTQISGFPCQLLISDNAPSVPWWWLSRRSAEPLCKVSRLDSSCLTAECLSFTFLDFQLTLDTVSGSQCMLLLVFITPFQCSRRLAWPSCYEALSKLLVKDYQTYANTSPDTCLLGMCKPKHASCPPFYNVHASWFWSRLSYTDLFTLQ